VLTGTHLATLREVFTNVCADYGADLVQLDGEDDHVHLLVAYPPQVAIARLVNSLKRRSARRLRQRYRVRTHRQHLWSPATRSCGWATADATATHVGIDPDRASFTIALNAARDQLILAAGVIAATTIDLVGTIGRSVLANLLPDGRLWVSRRIVNGLSPTTTPAVPTSPGPATRPP